MKLLKITFYNLFIFIFLIILIEIFFGYWFKDENFGIYMRKERKINWLTESTFFGNNYKFFYKRNYWGFRGEEFDPKNVKIIFEGGSTGNQRYTPEDLTIVGLINKRFENENINLKIFNASTDGKSLNGYINDFEFWFPKIPNLKPEYVIFYLGINDRFINDRYYLDHKISEMKIDRLKDYIKNNSFVVDKYKIIKNNYFPKNTLSYDFNDNSIYKDFKYIDFISAQKIHKNKNDDDLALINKFQYKLDKLNSIIKKNNIKPIFITQVKFDGLKDKKLYLINNELKNFSKVNDYFFIPIDELILMEINDFYDHVHTTPKGSSKIADIISKNIIRYLNE
jgi:hypothetical protein